MMLDSVELTRSKSIGWLELTGAVCMTFNLEYIERESKKLSLSRHCFFPLPLKGRIDSPLPSSVPRAILLVHNRKGGSKEMQLVINIVQMLSSRENLCLPLFFVFHVMLCFPYFLV